MLRRASYLTFCLSGIILSGCTQFPELDHTQTSQLEAADYPALIPIEPILARATGPQPDPALEQAQLSSRLNALRSRANRMRGTVLTGAEKQRLESGLQ